MSFSGTHNSTTPIEVTFLLDPLLPVHKGDYRIPSQVVRVVITVKPGLSRNDTPGRTRNMVYIIGGIGEG